MNLLMASVLNWAAFAAAHAGQPASALNVSASWHPAHGLVLHDGECAFSEAKLLGCHDPAGDEGGAADLACSEPTVRTDGVAWLHLHGEIFSPFSGAAAAAAPLPLWAFAHTTDPANDALMIWGYSYDADHPEGSPSDRQELWQWDAGAAVPRVVAKGPAELSGGIAAWPQSEGCFALTTYAMTDDACDGTSSIWKWCRSAPEQFDLAAQFHGCSGKIIAVKNANSVMLWNVGASRATGYTAFAPTDSAPVTLTAPSQQLAIFADGSGGLRRVLWDGAAVSIESPSINVNLRRNE